MGPKCRFVPTCSQYGEQALKQYGLFKGGWLLMKRLSTVSYTHLDVYKRQIQVKVYNAIQKIAVARVYDFILDKSEGITLRVADPKLDKSDEVLRELGIKN